MLLLLGRVGVKSMASASWVKQSFWYIKGEEKQASSWVGILENGISGLVLRPWKLLDCLKVSRGRGDHLNNQNHEHLSVKITSFDTVSWENTVCTLRNKRLGGTLH